MKYQITLDKISPDGFKQIVKSGKLFAQIKLSPFTGAGIQGTEILNSGDKIDCFEFEVTESGLYKCYTSTSLNGTYTERKSYGGSVGKEIVVTFYKSFVARFFHVLGSPPTLDILQNDFAADVTPSRDEEGVYRITFSEAILTESKTSIADLTLSTTAIIPIIDDFEGSANEGYYGLARQNATVLSIRGFDSDRIPMEINTGTLNPLLIEFKVYP